MVIASHTIVSFNTSCEKWLYIHDLLKFVDYLPYSITMTMLHRIWDSRIVTTHTPVLLPCIIPLVFHMPYMLLNWIESYCLTKWKSREIKYDRWKIAKRADEVRERQSKRRFKPWSPPLSHFCHEPSPWYAAWPRYLVKLNLSFFLITNMH